jgi:glycosyltransferase domain-containing protein
MNQHPDITIIIPTYQRTAFLKRLLQYYTDVRLMIPLLIADSSQEPAASANQAIIQDMRTHLNLHYQTYDPSMRPETKIAAAVETVTTKYTVLCADDDFLIPNGINQCVTFLESHTDYSIASGLTAFALGATTPDDRLFTAINNLYEGWHTRTFPQPSIEFPDPTTRLLHHMQQYAPTFYAVHHREHMRDNLRTTNENSAGVRLDELLLSCLSMLQGKMRVLPALFMVRQAHAHSEGQRATPWAAFMTSDQFSTHYARFRNTLAVEVTRCSGMPTAEAQELVNRVFVAYLPLALELPMQQCTLPHLMHQARKASGVIQHMLCDLVRPQHWRRALTDPRETYLHARAKQLMQADPLSLSNLLDSRSPYHNDFMPVYKHLQDYFAR